MQLDALTAVSAVSKDPDNENLTIGLGTEYEFDLEDDETKQNRPGFRAMPSLKPEADSLELGNESEYGGPTYSTRASTPNKLPTIPSPTTEFDPMTIEMANERNSTNNATICL